MYRGWEAREREQGLVLTPVVALMYIQPHLIGWFVVSLQKEDGRPDRPVRGERIINDVRE